MATSTSSGDGGSQTAATGNTGVLTIDRLLRIKDALTVTFLVNSEKERDVLGEVFRQLDYPGPYRIRISKDVEPGHVIRLEAPAFVDGGFNGL